MAGLLRSAARDVSGSESVTKLIRTSSRPTTFDRVPLKVVDVVDYWSRS